MRPPLDQWSERRRGYRFLQPTTYSPHHLGLDVSCAVGTPLLAAESGEVVWTGIGTEGGKTLHLRLDSGPLVRFLHLNAFQRKSGRVTEGELIAFTGNTGNSTGPHLHIDVWRNGRIDWQPIERGDYSNLLDPESFFTHDPHMALVKNIFNQPSVNDDVRVVICTEGKDAGKVGLLAKDGTLRVAQNQSGTVQALLATLSHGVTSADWATLGQKEGKPLK